MTDAGDLHGVDQAQLLDEPLDGHRVLLADGPPHHVEPGLGVVELTVGGQRLDQVVLALVGRDLAHEQQVGTATGLPVGQTGGQGGIGRPGEARPGR